MIPYIGDFPEDVTIVHYFNTFDSNNPTNSVTVTTLADSDLYVYKDGSTTEATTTGAEVDINFDTHTGVHKLTIDTSVHTFYETGSDYMVMIEGATVDSGNITAAIFTFSIENRYSDIVSLKGTAQGGTASTITLQSGHVVSSDNLNGYNIEITSGPGVGEERTITDSTVTTDVCVVAPDFIVQPTSASTYKLKPANNGVIDVDSNGLVNVGKVNSDSQTAGDIAALIVTLQAALDAGVDIVKVGGEAISKGGSAPSSPYGQT